jgi:DNA-binding transcriptional LysR family regulator
MLKRLLDPLTLRLFVSVCEEGNFIRAAERESIVPSAISKRLAALEEQIGLPLLTRSRGSYAPTPAGEVLLRQARDILGSMERAYAELDEFSTGVQGSVRVLASLSALAEFLAEDVSSFLATHQQVRVSLEEKVSAEIVRGVAEGAADFGVLWDETDLKGLQTASYRSDHVHLVGHPSHPLLQETGPIAFEAVLGHDLIGIAPSQMERKLQRHAELAGRPLVQRIRVSGVDAACRLIAARLGAALLPREAVGMHLAALGLVSRPLGDAWAQRHFVLCMRDYGNLSMTAKLFVEHLQESAREHAP